MPFLPTTVKEVEALGWDAIDVILFTGDAYVDHPAFGAAVVGRLLEAAGYRVAIVPQPNWRDDLRDFRKLGAPRLFFGVSAGAMDSMVNRYTATLRLRSDDAYTPGGKAGFRPDDTVITYTQILKRLYPHTPVVIGGIEASLRRLTHYDYRLDRLRPSILEESGADLLAYGMGEGVVTDIARALRNGYNANLLRKVRQVAFMADSRYVDSLPGTERIVLNSYETCCGKPSAFGDNFIKIETESNRRSGNNILVEGTGERFVVVNPPRGVITQQELDASFDLPYMRQPHPRYRGKGDIPAYEMIKHSVNIHRGCFGGCSFCTISAHQGKFVSSRSERSILREVDAIAATPGFKGYLSDVGGPSANMYGIGGRDASQCGKCLRPSCLFPRICRNLDNGHGPLLELYARIRSRKGIKKAFVGSGVRYDLIDAPSRERYLRELISNHTSGRLKVAPEHTQGEVLGLMRKPPFEKFEELQRDFRRICAGEGLRYQLVPYFISGHPGCGRREMEELARRVDRGGVHMEQVQEFTPTPMTLSSVMYYTGIDPYTGDKVYVAKNVQEKRAQKNYFFDSGTKGVSRKKE